MCFSQNTPRFAAFGGTNTCSRVLCCFLFSPRECGVVSAELNCPSKLKVTAKERHIAACPVAAQGSVSGFVEGLL